MRRALALLLIVLLTVPTMAGVALAQEHGQQAAGSSNTTAGAAASDWSIDELQQPGSRYEARNPSFRYLGATDANVMAYYPEVNFVKEFGTQQPDWAKDRDYVFTPGKTVSSDTATLLFSRPRGSQKETVRVRMLTWEKKQRTVNTTEGTHREQYAANVSESVQTVTLTGPATEAEIDLPSTDGLRHMTVLVESESGTELARWVVPRKSSPLSTSLPFDNSWAGYLPWFLWNFGLVAGIGVPIAIAGAYKLGDSVGTSPGKGVAWWMIIAGVGSYAALYFGMLNVAQLLTSLPQVLGIGVVLIAGIATLEIHDPSETARFEQLLVEKVTNPLGKERPSIARERGHDFKITEVGDQIHILKDNLKFFVLLLLGAEPPKIDPSEFEQYVEYGGDSDTELKIYAEDLPSVEWPTVEFGMSALKTETETVETTAPDGSDPGVAADGGVEVEQTTATEQFDRDRAARAFMFGSFGALVTQLVFSSYTLALAAGVAVAYVATNRVTDGKLAGFEAAAGMGTPAKARVVVEQNEYTVARTFEQLQRDRADDMMSLVEEAHDQAEAFVAESRQEMNRVLRGGVPSEDGPDPENAVQSSRNGDGGRR